MGALSAWQRRCTRPVELTCCSPNGSTTSLECWCLRQLYTLFYTVTCSLMLDTIICLFMLLDISLLSCSFIQLRDGTLKLDQSLKYFQNRRKCKSWVRGPPPPVTAVQICFHAHPLREVCSMAFWLLDSIDVPACLLFL